MMISSIFCISHHFKYFGLVPALFLLLRMNHFYEGLLQRWKFSIDSLSFPGELVQSELNFNSFIIFQLIH